MQGIVGNNPCHVLHRDIPFILNIIATGFAGRSYRLFRPYIYFPSTLAV
jgi:hypothetical protein